MPVSSFDFDDIVNALNIAYLYHDTDNRERLETDAYTEWLLLYNSILDIIPKGYSEKMQEIINIIQDKNFLNMSLWKIHKTTLEL
jgi:hypothetical protein